MHRAIVTATALAALLGAGPAAAQMTADQISAALKRQGASQGCADCVFTEGTTRGGRVVLGETPADSATGEVETEVAARDDRPAATRVAFPVRSDLPPEVDRADQVVLKVTFETNSAYIRPSAAQDLAEACKVFSRLTSQARLNVIGHTDASGAESYNETLSGARASAVARYFVAECGVERGQLIVFGAGERRLLPDVAPVSEANRRVEVSLAPFS